jgi:cephalosporin hydroxylase
MTEKDPKIAEFESEVSQRIEAQGKNHELRAAAKAFEVAATIPKYTYNFSWMGRPIIQYPQDMLAMQELIWNIRPELIIETGIAHGGSLIYYASLLELNAISGGPGEAAVLGIDIEIRPHNRAAIESHPMAGRISMIEASSIAADTIAQVTARARNKGPILVCLDSNHTCEHVLAELEAYAPLVSRGSYCVVFDTIVEDLPATIFDSRPWAPGNSPKTAVDSFLIGHPEFSMESSIDSKLLISMAPGGYLRRNT